MRTNKNRLEETLNHIQKTIKNELHTGPEALQSLRSNMHNPKGAMTRLYWCTDDELGLLFRVFAASETNLALDELWLRYAKRFEAQARTFVGGDRQMAHDAVTELKIRVYHKNVQRGFNPVGRGNGWQSWASTILYHESLQLIRRRRTVRWELKKTAVQQLGTFGVPKEILDKLQGLVGVSFYDEGSLQNDVQHVLGSSFDDYWPMIRDVAKRGVHVAPLSDANLAGLRYPDEPRPDDREQMHELGTVMVECLDELREVDRDVLLLWVLTKLTYKEIAARLKIGEGTVALCSTRARTKMQRLLRQRGYGTAD